MKSNINAKPRDESTSVDYENPTDPDPNIRGVHTSGEEDNEEEQSGKIERDQG